MYYLRKNAYEKTIPEITKTNGEVIPERKYTVNERAIYKARGLSRFYRQDFKGIDSKVEGMKLYTCKKLSTILNLRQTTFNYCGEWFDVYDDDGIVHGEWENRQEEITVNENTN